MEETIRMTRNMDDPVVPHREITALALFFDVRVHSVVWVKGCTTQRM